MSNSLDFVPDGYETLTKREISNYSCEHIASYKADNTLVNLRIYSFAGTSDTTKSRHLRNYLRRDVGFMDEFDHPNIIHLFDYSESRKHFWIATQPAKIEKLSESFSKLKGIPLIETVRPVQTVFSLAVCDRQESVHDLPEKAPARVRMHDGVYKPCTAK